MPIRFFNSSLPVQVAAKVPKARSAAESTVNQQVEPINTEEGRVSLACDITIVVIVKS